MKPVRTRFAPSPTGYLHVGGIRTALFAWLVARQAGGEFILRIEDTDRAREVEGAEAHIMESLHALGLDYDEGPDAPGDYGPYRQTERLAKYQEWAQVLIDAGRAYADPYSAAEVQKFREEAQAAKKPFLYRNHRPENPPAWDGKTPLRFKSDPKDYEWHDAVMGDLHAGHDAIDDFILIKSDGFPTYNFAHIVDDHEMAISHVIRGQEFISSMPNFLNLYEALGFGTPTVNPGMNEPTGELQGEGKAGEFISTAQRRGEPLLPIFATMPHILGPDGNKKLSKRDGAKDVLDYLRDGFLVEAVVNFIASLGWNDGTEQEIFTREELIEKFSLERVQRSGARFDENRLLWMNGHWIRSLDIDSLYQRISESRVKSQESRDFWPETAKNYPEDYKKQVLGLVQERLKYFAELPQLTDFFFEDLPVNMELIDGNKQLKKFASSELASLLEMAKASLEQSDFSLEDLSERLNTLLETTGQKPGVLFSLIRIATTQAPSSPSLAETLSVLGRETVFRRIERQLAVL